MASIVNKIFGHKDHKEEHSAKDKEGHSEHGSSTSASGVQVKSKVSTDAFTKVTAQSQMKVKDLLGKLGSTHSQIDEYSKKQNQKITDQVKANIQKVVEETQAQQEQLLSETNTRSQAIEHEYSTKLEAAVTKIVEELDVPKAQELANLEKDMQQRQEAILTLARKRIDDLNADANQAKIGVLLEAQTTAKDQAAAITDQVANLSAADSQRRMEAKTTTTIESQTKAAGGTSSTSASGSGTSASMGTTSGVGTTTGIGATGALAGSSGSGSTSTSNTQQSSAHIETNKRN